MLDVKDFSFFENQNGFDFKGFLIKTGSYWKWFLLGLVICLTIAHQINIRKQKIYSLESTLAIKEQDNPLFTSNTSLVFNWGGTSDQVQSIATTLKSRLHNELVVNKLDFFVEYLQEQKYFTQDVYGTAPFIVKLDKTKNQIYQTPINITFISPTEYEISIVLNSNTVPVINYSSNQAGVENVSSGEYKKRFKVGQKVNLPFLNWELNINNNSLNYTGSKYIVKFNSFDSTVSRYRNVKIIIDEKAASIIKLSMENTNKARIVDYLNETVLMLMKKQLESKNLFAENTIKYIDTTLSLMEIEVKLANDELKDFSRNRNILEIERTYLHKKIQDYKILKKEYFV